MSKGEYRRAKLTRRLVESAKPGESWIEIHDTAQKGLVLRIQPSGIKSFVCVYGRAKKKTIGRFPDFTVSMARKRCEQWRGSGGPPEAHAPEPEAEEQQTTLGEFIEGTYSTYARAHNRAPEENLKRLGTCYRDWWDVPLADINAATVELYRVNGLRRGASPATINRDVGRLQSVLSRAVEWGQLDKHPLQGFKPLKLDRQHVVRYLSPAEETRLRAALEKAPGYLRVMVLVAINTGLRRAELFTLQWSNVDLQRRQLTVIGSLSKTGQTRYIPLNQEATDTLHQWREQTGDSGLVFKSHTGGTYNNTKRSWRALLAKAQIENFRWHDLRHHFASALVMAGADLYAVGQLLGHSSVEITKRYAHLAPWHLADVVARLDR